MNEKFKEFVDAVQSGNTEVIKEIINTAIDGQDTTIIKCHNCGEPVALSRTRDLYFMSANKMAHTIKYQVLKHMAEDPEHDIVLPLPMGMEMHISQILESRLRSHCKRGDEHGPVHYETWFPTYVEHYHKKFIEKG